MHVADAVLSGGVRRSATLCVFSADDVEMAQAKTGNWLSENPQRARSNNSALLLRNHTTIDEFRTLMECVKDYGEPGFIWCDDLEFLANPCVEIGFWCYEIIDQKKYDKYMETYDGTGYKVDLSKIGLTSGWQGCNLSTINCASIKSEEDFIERATGAAYIGTLQAGFTQFEYLEPTSQRIFEREALLGVSMTGTMENFEIVLNPDVQKQAAKAVMKANQHIADKLKSWVST
jgi:ribonucleoside-diphosphate reductase alpha chain